MPLPRGCARKIKSKDNKKVINCGYQIASSKVYGQIPLTDVILSRYFAPVGINGNGIHIKMAYLMFDVGEVINDFIN